mgnify:CR=1 FL=1
MKHTRKLEAWTWKHWAATLLLISAFACAALFGGDQDPSSRQRSGAFLGFALGLSMLLWGVINVEEGRIKGRRRYYRRDEHPGMFAFLMAFKIVLPAVCGLLVGFFHAFPGAL